MKYIGASADAARMLPRRYEDFVTQVDAFEQAAGTAPATFGLARAVMDCVRQERFPLPCKVDYESFSTPEGYTRHYLFFFWPGDVDVVIAEGQAVLQHYAHRALILRGSSLVENAENVIAGLRAAGVEQAASARCEGRP